MSEGRVYAHVSRRAAKGDGNGFCHEVASPSRNANPGDVNHLTTSVKATSVGKDFGYIGVGENSSTRARSNTSSRKNLRRLTSPTESFIPPAKASCG